MGHPINTVISISNLNSQFTWEVPEIVGTYKSNIHYFTN